MSRRIILMNRMVRASKAQVFNETIETYFDTTRSAEVKSLIAEIRSTDDANKPTALPLPTLFQLQGWPSCAGKHHP